MPRDIGGLQARIHRLLPRELALSGALDARTDRRGRF
jgi:hypothetical protein